MRKSPVEAEEFSRKLQTVYREVEALQNQVGSTPEQTQSDLLAAALTRLTEIIEEMGVAEEELGVQSAELFATRDRLEQEQLRYQDLFDNAPYAYFVTDGEGVILNANRQAAALLDKPVQYILNKPLVVFLPADQYATFYTELGRLQKAETLKVWETQFVTRSGSAIEVRISANRIDLAVDNRSTFRWLVQDITQQKKTERRLAQLQAVTAALSEAMRPEDVVDVIVQQGCTIVGADACTVVELAQNDTMLEVVKSVGYPQEIIERWYSFPIAHLSAPIAACVRLAQPVWLPSREAVTTQYSPEFPINVDDIYNAWACVPLTARGRMIGAIGFSFPSAQAFNHDDQAFILTLAHHCAQALERAHLAEQAQVAAALEERQRLARDLHDAVSQTLFTANVLSQSLPLMVERSPDKAQEAARELADVTHSALAEMRTLLLELRPEQLVNRPLGDLLAQLAQTVQGRKHIQFRIDVEDKQSLPADAHVAFYRVAQEALNNVMKYAQAGNVTIFFRSSAEQTELRISDDGVGFDQETTRPSIGTAIMRERTHSISGSLRVESAPGRGTTVRLLWKPPVPLPDSTNPPRKG
jgi:PAS domain S-box-containing protein